MADDDFEEQFALFQRQIQTVTAKRRKLDNEHATPSTKTDIPVVQSGTAPSSKSPTPAVTVRNETILATFKAPPKPATQSIGPSSSSRKIVSAPPQTGRWKWDGHAWKWEVTSEVPQTSTGASQVPSVATAPVGGSVHVAANPSFPLKSAALPPSSGPPTSPGTNVAHGALSASGTKRRGAALKRTAAGKTWEDRALAQFPENDHRIFVGDLAPDASEAELERAFSRYPSYNMARVVRDKHTGLCRGYGFVSFAAGEDMIAALKEMNGKYVGSRPVKLKKSTWQKRTLSSDKRKELREFRAVMKGR